MDKDEFSSGQKFNLSKFFAGERLSPQHLQSIEEVVGPIMDKEFEKFREKMGKRMGSIERTQQNLKGALILIPIIISILAIIWNNSSPAIPPVKHDKSSTK